MKRMLGYYVIKMYVPSGMIVFTAFVGFWIPPSAVAPRVALDITALLALITQQIRSNNVEVSYIIAINLWMLGCTGFVFFSLVETAVAVVVDRASSKPLDKVRKENKHEYFV